MHKILLYGMLIIALPLEHTSGSIIAGCRQHLKIYAIYAIATLYKTLSRKDSVMEQTTKHVLIIYTNSTNPIAIDHITQSLTQVFEGYVEFTNYFLPDLGKGIHLDADAYLITADSMLPILRRYVDDDAKIFKMTRSPSAESLEQISQIPPKSNVLVVNDTYESTIQTAYSLYEPAFGNLNLIPYNSTLEHTGIYKDIQYAITPGELQLVPEYISHIINIGYREVSFSTMLHLMYMLDLDIDLINRNLFRHLHSVIEPDTGFHDNYVGNYLKSQMLRYVVRTNSSAILLADSRHQIIYANEKAEAAFRVSSAQSIDLALYLNLDTIKKENVSSLQVYLPDGHYCYDQHVLTLMDEIVGYYITLQREEDFLSQNNAIHEKGFFARHSFEDFISQSTEMAKVIETAKKIALTDYTVLIQGESGTGKELVAQSLHNYSNRSKKPFVAINCASLSDSLLESELFGYEEGSFTGARKKGKIGLFEQANHGTLFLDEIGDISPKLQSQLLRVLQEKQIMRVGSDRIVDIDVRIFAATNRDLAQAVQEGTFRSDLFYRLCVIPIILPPLRERRADILPLLRHYLGKSIHQIKPSDLTLLADYAWPGNVRELENVALYYKSLLAFPDYLIKNMRQLRQDSASAVDDSSSLEPSDPQNVSHLALSIIGTATTPGHGIGRSQLLYQLKDLGLAISDGKLRAIMHQLESQQLITINKGRGGAQITEKGSAYLK